MFDLKKEDDQKNSPQPPANEADTKNIRFHTMQDDEDILEGKKSPEEYGAINPPDYEKNSQLVYGSEEKNKPSAKNSSPFLGNTDISYPKAAPPSNIPTTDLAKNASLEPKKKIEDTVLNVPVAKKSSVLSKMLFTVSIILVVAAFAFGGYYFWTIRNAENQESIATEPEASSSENQLAENLTEETSQAEISQSKFSETNPNYLPIDIGMATADTVSKLFISKAAEIKGAGTTNPVEFLVTDTNNDPISFSAFNYLSGMKIPSTILTNLEDKFSLFFYNDNGNMRMGLAVDLKEKDKVAIGFKNEEKLLDKDLAPLFLGTAINDTSKIFKDSSYNGFSIRYNNLDNENLISVDYSITDKYLVIGTSKQTLRVILDKLGE